VCPNICVTCPESGGLPERNHHGHIDTSQALSSSNAAYNSAPVRASVQAESARAPATVAG
jgi:hypothetical protein